MIPQSILLTDNQRAALYVRRQALGAMLMATSRAGDQWTAIRRLQTSIATASNDSASVAAEVGQITVLQAEAKQIEDASDADKLRDLAGQIILTQHDLRYVSDQFGELLLNPTSDEGSVLLGLARQLVQLIDALRGEFSDDYPGKPAQ